MRAVILLAALLSIASSTSVCPPEESIHPCMCMNDDIDVDLTLACNDEGMTQDDLSRVLRAFDKKDSLAVELDGLELGRLPSRYFENVNVKRLEIWHSVLEGLTKDGEDGRPLAGLEDTLEELTLASSLNDDAGPLKFDFSHLRRLQLLELSFNSISELGDDWFRHGPQSLTGLVLSNVGIEKLGSRAFAGLTNLKSLELNGNRFGPLKRSMLPNPANKLEKLELDNNALTDLPDDMFSNMPSLTRVTLRTNGLRKMPRETFEPIWQQLGILDIRGNSLECDSHLEWMFHVRSMVRVLGKCESPPEKDGVELEDLIKGKVML